MSASSVALTALAQSAFTVLLFVCGGGQTCLQAASQRCHSQVAASATFGRTLFQLQHLFWSGGFAADTLGPPEQAPQSRRVAKMCLHRKTCGNFTK